MPSTLKMSAETAGSPGDKALPMTAAMSRMARKIVCFEEPEEASSDPLRFLAYAMARAAAWLTYHWSADDCGDARTMVYRCAEVAKMHWNALVDERRGVRD